MPFKLEFESHEVIPFPTSWLVYRDDLNNRVEIDRVYNAEDGVYRFAVRWNERNCLSVTGEWSREGFPSGRPNDWLETHRFSNMEDAFTAAVVAAADIHLASLERIELLNKAEAGRDQG